jgi:hypothetical protein
MTIKKLTRAASLIIMEDAVNTLLEKDFKKEVWDKSFDHQSFLKAADDEELYQVMCEMFFNGMFADQITKMCAACIKDLLD